MTLRTMPAILAVSMLSAPRGVFAAPRSEVDTDPKTMLDKIHAAVNELRTKHDTAMADVVRQDEIERINATISNLEAALAKREREAASADLGGAGARAGDDPEYRAVWNAHMRNPMDRGIEASLKKSPTSDGGFLAPVEWDRTIIDKLEIISQLRGIFSVVQSSSAGFKKLVNQRGTLSGWVSETAPRPETNTATFAELSFTSGELYANPGATRQMLDDALVDLEAWLLSEIATEFGKQEGTAFISGDGVNKPTGILTYATGKANASAHPLGAIAVRNSGAAAALSNADVLIDLVHDLPSQHAQQASFMMNRLTLATCRKFKDSTGQYLWQPSMQAGQPSTLLGYPVNEVAAMPNIAANADPILFGDLSQAYLINDRSATSILTDPYSNKPYLMFYAIKRVGGGLNNPECVKALRIAV